MAQRRGPDGTVRVAVSGVLNGEAWANVFWANLVGGTTATQAGLDAWNSSFGEQYATTLGPQIGSNCSITECMSTLFQPGSTALHSIHGMAHNGTNSSVALQNNATSAVLSWLSAVYWRGGKPRTYLPGMPANWTADGRHLTTAVQAQLTTAAGAWHTAINGLSAPGITQTQHGFVSFMTGGTLRNPSVFFPITGGTAHSRLGTQRGRLGSWAP